MTDTEKKSWLEIHQPELTEFFDSVHGSSPLKFILAETKYKLASFDSWASADQIGRWVMESRLHHFLSCIILEATYAAASEKSKRSGISRADIVRRFAQDGCRSTSKSSVYAAISDAVERGYFLQRDTGRDVYVFAAMGFLKSHFEWTERQARTRETLNIPRLARDVDINDFRTVTKNFAEQYEIYLARTDA